MQSIAIPNTTLTVSPLCLGTADFGTKIPQAQAQQVTEAFVAAGGNFLDTAHVYAAWVPGGNGKSETTLGNIVRALNVRDSVILATKGGHPVFDNYPRPDRYLSPERVRQDIAESLERLQTGVIDLYYLHRDDPRVPVGEILDALNQEIQAGRIRAIGASNWSKERVQAANTHAETHGLHGFSVSQIFGSLARPKWTVTDDPTNRFLSDTDALWYAENQIPVVAYSATASGYFANSAPGEALYGTPENARRRERAQTLATRKGVTPSQIALASLRHLPPTVIPLFGTGSRTHLQEAIQALSLVLSPDEMDFLQSDQN